MSRHCAPGTCTHEVTHGLYRTYNNHGCRCELCREGARLYRRARVLAGKTSPKCVEREGPCPHLEQLEHGGLTAYTGHGCRCELCRAGWRRYQREIKARRRVMLRRGQVQIRHGGSLGYDHYGCRCRRCRLYHARVRREQYVRARNNSE